jgi:cell wall-associated NlpC family hydrolase
VSRAAVSAALDPPAPRLDGEAEAAVVAVGLSALRREPDQKAELLSQGLFGEPLDVLDRTADGRWLKVAGPDGYPGWTRSWSLATGTREAVAEWGRLATRFVRQPLLWTGGEAGLLPLGARLADDPLRPDGVRGPNGAIALRASDIRKLGPLAPSPARRRAVLKAAELLVGAPYLWGGRSAAGIDCSGLVQLAYGMCGVTLPRDARDQCAALGGARGLRPYRPGARGGTPRRADFLFFGPEGPDGDVTHVALSTGGPGLLHAYGRVGAGSLDPAAANYESELPPLVLGWAPAALAGLAQAGPAADAASRTPRTA